MQEDINNRTASLMIQTTKLTARTFKRLLEKTLAEMKAQQRAAQQKKAAPKTYKGKQSVKQLIRKDRYLTPEEHNRYEELQRIKAETDPMPKIEYDACKDYSAVKNAHADDIVLYQVGDFFEMYGEDAKSAAGALDIALTTRVVALVERVPMCGIPANRLEQYVEQLRDKYDVTISAVEQQSGQRRVYSLPSIDHEAERATDAHEAEFGADDWRAFPGNAPEQEETPPVSTPRTEITQDDIGAALQRWNGDVASKRRVQNYMTDHAREKGTAECSPVNTAARQPKACLSP